MADDDDQATNHGSRPRRPPTPDLDGVLDAARADQPWAYTRLFEWLGGPVAGYLRSQGAEDPDDLANDVFLRAFTNLHRFEGDEPKFRSWVFTIAHRRAVDHWRARARRVQAIELGSAHEGPPVASAEDSALAGLSEASVVALLSGLTADQRDVLTLRILGDLTVEQVAAVLGKREGAVKALQRRGLAQLKVALRSRPGQAVPL